MTKTNLRHLGCSDDALLFVGACRDAEHPRTVSTDDLEFRCPGRGVGIISVCYRHQHHHLPHFILRDRHRVLEKQTAVKT